MLGDCAQLSIGVQFWTPIDTLTTRKEKLIKIGAKVKVVSRRSDRPILSNGANPSAFASRAFIRRILVLQLPAGLARSITIRLFHQRRREPDLHERSRFAQLLARPDS